MMNPSTNSPAPARHSTAPSIREDFACQVYQDFQEYINNRFGQPTSVIMVRSDGTLQRCFPRERYKSFCDFCRTLNMASAASRQESMCVGRGNQHVTNGIQAEKSGGSWEWGWIECHMGLEDFYLPIRATNLEKRPRPILAVLVVGHYRDPGPDALQRIHDRIDAVTTGNEWPHYFPGVSREQRQGYAGQLHELADSIPEADDHAKYQLTAELHDAVMLMQFIATRTLQKSTFTEVQNLVDSLGLEGVSRTVTEAEIWQLVAVAMKKLLDQLPLTTVTLYSSSGPDYTEMDLRIAIPNDLPVSQRIGLASFNHFEWIVSHEGVEIPSTHPSLDWASPQLYSGADRAIVYAMQTPTNRLIIMAFGHPADQGLTPRERSLLNEALRVKFFPFLERELYDVELDLLTTETGHLMGSAWGRVKLGFKALTKITTEEMLNPEDREIYEPACWALEDGITRLELIKNNFYSFRERRLGYGGYLLHEDEQHPSGSESPAVPRQLPLVLSERIDLIVLLRELRPYFERSLHDEDVRLRFEMLCESAVVAGRQNDLRLVFLNLFDNMSKFAYNGTFATIRAVVADNSCTITYRNLGLGVPQDEWRRVFQRFVRSHYQDPYRVREGLGLGLHFCKQIVEAHNGTIRLESRQARTPTAPRFPGDNWVTDVTLSLPLLMEEEIHA